MGSIVGKGTNAKRFVDSGSDSGCLSVATKLTRLATTRPNPVHASSGVRDLAGLSSGPSGDVPNAGNLLTPIQR